MSQQCSCLFHNIVPYHMVKHLKNFIFNCFKHFCVTLPPKYSPQGRTEWNNQCTISRSPRKSQCNPKELSSEISPRLPFHSTGGCSQKTILKIVVLGFQSNFHGHPTPFSMGYVVIITMLISNLEPSTYCLGGRNQLPLKPNVRCTQV